MLSGPAPAAGQASFPGAPDEQSVNVRVYPTALWGPRVGIGVGAGLVAHALARPDDQWLLTAAPARHEQVGTLSFASANPRRARQFVLVDTRALHTDRDWVGPWTLRRSGVRGRVRVGHTFLDQRLLVQPHATALSTVVSAVTPRDGIPAVRRSSSPHPATGSHTGLRAGLSLRFDTQSDGAALTRGVRLQGTWDHYLPLDGSGLRFDQFDLDAYGRLPIYKRHRLWLRLSATLTVSDAALPLWMQPTLSGTVVPGWKRAAFVGPDRLLGSLLYRFPLYQISNVTVVEGHLGGHPANVYQDLSRRFRPTVRFETSPLSDAEPPLRPTASAGLRFGLPFRPRLTLDLAVGVGPNGTTATTVSFSRRLHALRLPHHSADPVR